MKPHGAVIIRAHWMRLDFSQLADDIDVGVIVVGHLVVATDFYTKEPRKDFLENGHMHRVRAVSPPDDIVGTIKHRHIQPFMPNTKGYG